MADMQNKNKDAVSTTQGFLRIAEIKSDTVVMDDGTLRAILAISSTNFDLKSQEEQNGIIFGFQRFLNALEFPIQILMQSRKMEIGNYLEKLKHIAEKQTNELLRVQTTEYIDFINRLVENASVMNKNFYMVVPLGISILPPAGGFFSNLFGGKTKQAVQRVENFEKEKEDLDNRVSSVMGNIAGLGVRAARLKTEELIQLYYNSYNFESGPVIDPAQLGDIKVVQS
jgi:hypothetical protein